MTAGGHITIKVLNKFIINNYSQNLRVDLEFKREF